MTTPQGGNTSESGVVRITRKAVAGAGKPPAAGAGNPPADDDTTGTGAAETPDADTNASPDGAAEATPGRDGAGGVVGANTSRARAPGTKSTAAKSTGATSAAAAKATPRKAAAGSAKTTPGVRKAAGQGPRRSNAPQGGGRRRPAPVVVAKSRNWTAISLVTTAVLVFVAIVGYGVYAIHQKGLTFQQKADGISGVVDYRKTDPGMLTRVHVSGVVNYKVSPPVGGNHNINYQRCAADIYPAAIANENAVHALEHGAVWITYRPDLPANQVAQLSAEVKKFSDFILMSPYPGLSAPISLQAWGFQLKVNNASDPRIDKFVRDLRMNASMEPGIDCTSGNYVTATGTTPHDLGAPTTAPSGAASAAAPAPSASQ
jgi:hypothetical protein